MRQRPFISVIFSESMRGKAQDNFTDPQSRIMKTSADGFQQCYNAQLAVEGENQLIVAVAVASNASDQGRLTPLVEAPIGWIKEALVFRRFSVRGLTKVRGEWDLVCLALNVKRMQGLEATA